MCGIAGITGIDQEKAAPLIALMTRAIAHRGPDAEGMFVQDGIALGHRRLSIIDLSHGADQPFVYGDGRYVIVFNGEIYNYLELRSQIDHAWKSSSDTEVIVAAYAKWGKDCLPKLNGMFAFAIWDNLEATLFMARDRLGVKPLYYSETAQGLVFASEIRSILSSGLVERKTDPAAIADYLRFNTVRTPATIVSKVLQLCPGQYAFWKDGKLQKDFYWKMAQSVRQSQGLSHKELIDATRSRFMESVRSRMVADVGVGAFLSGGIDSSAVVACMAELSGRPVQTFSIVFDEKEFDESAYSDLIARRYQTDHRKLLLQPSELLLNLPACIKAMDSPTVDGINTYMVSRLVAATGIKVVLTGIGGDELFAGYPGFHRWKTYLHTRLIARLPFVSDLAGLLSGVLKNRKLQKICDLFSSRKFGLETFYSNSRSVFSNKALKKILKENPTAMPAWAGLDSPEMDKLPAFSRYSIAELTQYTLDVLMKDTDQMSMAWALEVREPFFDYRLCEFILGVQDRDKYRKGIPKSLLVEAMGDLLPPEIVHRPKKGFTFPWNKWLKNDLNVFCKDALTSLEQRGLFREKAVWQIWDDFNKGKAGWLHVWSLVVLELWMQENQMTS